MQIAITMSLTMSIRLYANKTDIFLPIQKRYGKIAVAFSYLSYRLNVFWGFTEITSPSTSNHKGISDGFVIVLSVIMAVSIALR